MTNSHPHTLTERELIDLLASLRHIHAELDDLERRKRDIRKHFRVTSFESVGTPSQNPTQNRGLESVVEALEKLENEFSDLTLTLINRTIFLEALLRRLKPLQRQIIRQRYYDGLEWPSVAKSGHMSLRTVYRVHKTALRDMVKCDTIYTGRQ